MVAERRCHQGFPAHAGMDPRGPSGARLRAWFPRTRGDGPRHLGWSRGRFGVSPHTRGWTLRLPGREPGPHGFPAHAGMDPCRPWPGSGRPRFPRTRGDGPARAVGSSTSRMVSPHTRGWTLPPFLIRVEPDGFPAHAGMDPAAWARYRPSSRFPRTRGDGPCRVSSPALLSRVSPHTRGWTPYVGGGDSYPPGFPAHAGMDPRPMNQQARRSRFPRTRGDGPGRLLVEAVSSRVSPHTRGWTRGGPLSAAGVAGFPAHAGMDPEVDVGAARRVGFPRTRGDGPCLRSSSASSRTVSPHTRGWTPEQEGVPALMRGFPAHAGMDP